MAKTSFCERLFFRLFCELSMFVEGDIVFSVGDEGAVRGCVAGPSGGAFSFRRSQSVLVEISAADGRGPRLDDGASVDSSAGTTG
jgi:hypothetical protein